MNVDRILKVVAKELTKEYLQKNTIIGRNLTQLKEVFPDNPEIKEIDEGINKIIDDAFEKLI